MFACSRQARRLMLLVALLAGVFARPILPVSARGVAAPAAPVTQTLTQPDGTTFSAQAWGDEWQHGLETEAGYTIQNDPTSGFWVYVQDAGSASGSPAVSGAQPLVVGRDEPGDLPRHLRPAASDGLKASAPLAADAADAADAAANSPSVSNLGTQRVLVLLVSFQGRDGTYPASTFAARFFGTSGSGAAGTGSGAAGTGSVRAFYQQASFGRLLLQPASESYGTANDGIIGWLKLPYAHPNDSNQSPKIVNDALGLANPYINFAAYDSNHDGAISTHELHIVVIAAGYEQSFSSGLSPSIWAHRWYLNAGGYRPVLDGVRLGQSGDEGGYAIFGEIHAFASNGAPVNPHPATIGVMAHELGHDLDWPDLYDTSNTSSGVGAWSIMGGGSWNTTHAADGLYGDTPALPDAFSKWYQGWISPRAPFSGSSPVLSDAASTPSALLLGINPLVDWNFETRSGAGEYWLVENRNRSGFDAALPGCGVLVWHIDESVTYQNTANANRDHPLVGLVQADGRQDLYNHSNSGDAGDPFPGSTAKTSLSAITQPSLLTYKGTSAGHALWVLSPNCASSITLHYSNSLLNHRMSLPLLNK